MDTLETVFFHLRMMALLTLLVLMLKSMVVSAGVRLMPITTHQGGDTALKAAQYVSMNNSKSKKDNPLI